jgi:hypothetical protein
MQDPIKQTDGRMFTPYTDGTLGHYVNRDGDACRIVAIDGDNLIGVRQAGTGWCGDTWKLDGVWMPGRESEDDLMDPPVVETRWFNIYDHTGHDSKEEANDDAYGPRLACVAVTFTNGDGL